MRVCVTLPEKTAFQLIKSPRVDFVPSDGGCATADAFVVPMHTRTLEQAFQEIPTQLQQTIAASTATVVLDCSGEGVVHRPLNTDQMHSVLDARRISPSRCLYLTQDRMYGRQYNAYCDSKSINDRMSVSVYDYYVSRLFISLTNHGGEIYSNRIKRYRARGESRSRRFISLNYSVRPTKLALLLCLLRDELWDHGFVSFGRFTRPKSDRDGAPGAAAVLEDLAAKPAFADLAKELQPLLPTLLRHGPKLFGQLGLDPQSGVVREQKHLSLDVNLDEYDQSWFSVITETEMGSRVHRVTEKPFKALLNFHPIIVLGNPGSLKLLMEYGFKTFEGFFDEAYDEESDPRKRFEMVYGQVNALCMADEVELSRLHAGVSETLIFNAHRGLVELPRVFHDEINAALLDDVERLSHAGAAA